MGYKRKTISEVGRAMNQLDSLESQVLRVLSPFGKFVFEGDGLSSRYLLIGDNRGAWGVKIRVADHANTTTDGMRNQPDVNLVTTNQYTDEQIWRKIMRAIARNAD